jgi:hypothetical protein
MIIIIIKGKHLPLHVEVVLAVFFLPDLIFSNISSYFTLVHITLVLLDSRISNNLLVNIKCNTCPSVCLSVCLSFRPSLHPSVRPALGFLRITKFALTKCFQILRHCIYRSSSIFSQIPFIAHLQVISNNMQNVFLKSDLKM